MAPQEVFIRQLRPKAVDETELSWRSGSGPDSLSTSEVHLWLVSLEQTHERIQAFREVLSAGERLKGKRLHFERDRDAFCICRGYLRTLLGRYGGLAPERVRLTRGTYGKPALDPRIHPKDIEFNVSHSGRWALIALAKGRRLGVDIQKIDAAVDRDLIAQRFFSTQENESIRAFPEEMRTAAFYACWTRKEAAVKALGGSITRLSDEIIVSTAPRGPLQILQMPSSGPDDGWHLQDLPVGDGYAAALCYERPLADVFLWLPDA
jgi:4'-phosphopantetheinyl transferase